MGGGGRGWLKKKEALLALQPVASARKKKVEAPFFHPPPRPLCMCVCVRARVYTSVCMRVGEGGGGLGRCPCLRTSATAQNPGARPTQARASEIFTGLMNFIKSSQEAVKR